MSETRIDSKEEAAVASSSVYTASEGLLLKWLNHHVAKHSGADVSAISDFSKVSKQPAGLCRLESQLIWVVSCYICYCYHLSFINHSQDLEDGSVLAHVILSHVPSLQAAKGPLEGFCPITKVMLARTPSAFLILLHSRLPFFLFVY